MNGDLKQAIVQNHSSKMCLLFFETKNDPEPDAYKLIFFNIRDEFYTRPTKPADVWEENDAIVGGRDLETGRNGGTWLAMNKKSGKIAALLNILQPNHEIVSTRRGRGFIVNNFVTGSQSCHKYLQELSREGHDYNGFQTITLQVRADSVEGAYYSNFMDDEPQEIEPGLHGYGNSINPKDPWPKVTYGKKRFQAIIRQHHSTATKEKLIEELFESMMDKTILPLDEQMKTQGSGRAFDSLCKLSSLCVQMPEAQYGSRTWTTILVDAESHVDYIERTLEEPIECNETGVQNKWIARRYSFKL